MGIRIKELRGNNGGYRGDSRHGRGSSFATVSGKGEGNKFSVRRAPQILDINRAFSGYRPSKKKEGKKTEEEQSKEKGRAKRCKEGLNGFVKEELIDRESMRTRYYREMVPQVKAF